MNSNSRTKILVVAVIFLLLTNIGVLVYFMSYRGPGKRDSHGGGREAVMREFLQKDIGFSTQQMQQYDTLNKLHRENLKAAFDEMRNKKELQFRELGRSAFSDSAIAAAAENNTAMQKEMELNLIRHFTAIRKLCSAGQQPRFDSLFYKIWNKKDDKKKKPVN